LPSKTSKGKKTRRASSGTFARLMSSRRRKEAYGPCLDQSETGGFIAEQKNNKLGGR